MKVSWRHAVGGSWRPVAAVGLAVLATVSAVIAVGAIAALMARTVVTPPRVREEDTEVLAVDASAKTITLSNSADARVNGSYSFWFSGGNGHARIGKIFGVHSTTNAQSSRKSLAVTRELIGVDFGDLAAAVKGRINGWFFLDPSDLGVCYESVTIETEVGAAPAWLVRSGGGEADSARWVIQIHGRAALRTETLRAIPVFGEAGYTQLLISYRNDGEAPESADGLYRLGETEWKDVDSALSFALEHGAESVVLMGWSMGGALALQTVCNSEQAGVITGIVMDSPVVDWVTALDFQAKSKGLIKPVRSIVYAMLSGSWARCFTGQHEPIDLDSLNFLRRSAELQVPILILHSDDDGFVTSSASHALAEVRPDIVTLEVFSTARHAKLWNFDPERWNSSIASWIRKTQLPPTTTANSTEHRGRSRSR